MARRTCLLPALAGLCVLSASVAHAQTNGPDVIVGDLPNMQHFGTLNGVAAYSIATTSCNVGNQQLLWIQSTNQHPVIAQNLYLIRDGRLRQIGQSWLKHGFCALQQTICGSCQPAGGGCVSRLGVGCSDPYSSSLNGEQGNLGPRSQVNPWTGAFPYPFTATPPQNSTTSRRLQVSTSDLPPLTPISGSIWLMEGQYVAADDSAAGNQNNNASYRRVNFTTNASNPNGSPSLFNNSGHTTQRQKPAIIGWKDVDSMVSVAEVTVPAEGRLYMAGRAVNNGDGTWTYNYAVYNLNSHRAVNSVSIPLSCGAQATNLGFSHPPSHSGEPYSNAAWDMAVRGGDAVVWETESFADNANANAIRWGTTYSFWFTSPSAPASGGGVVTLGLFRTPGEVSVTGLPVPSAGCRADWNGDGNANSGDITAFLSDWLASVQDGTLGGDHNCDGAVNSGDVTSFLSSWLNAVGGTGC